MTDAERPFVAEAIHSVQHQTIQSSLVICVTTGNGWIDEVLSASLPGITVMRLPLAPLGQVRNAAVATLDCDLVAFLDADDAWLPPKLERQLALMRTKKLDVVATKHKLVRDDGKPFFYAFALDYPMPSSWLTRLDRLREWPFPDIRVGEDIPVWDHFRREARVGVLDEFLLRYRVRPGSLSQGTPSMRRKRAYERRSHTPGVRHLLLGASYATSLGMQVASPFFKTNVPHFRHP